MVTNACKRRRVNDARRLEDTSRMATMIANQFIESHLARLPGQSASLAELRVSLSASHCFVFLSRFTSVHSHRRAIGTVEKYFHAKKERCFCHALCISEVNEAQAKLRLVHRTLNPTTCRVSNTEQQAEDRIERNALERAASRTASSDQ